MVIEATLKCEKWVFISVYKQPKVGINKLVTVGKQLLSSCYREYKDIVLMGDLNVNMLAGDTGSSRLLEVYGLTNLVKKSNVLQRGNGKSVRYCGNNGAKETAKYLCQRHRSE